jgi:N-acyl homoserine lactone hydrolase
MATAAEPTPADLPLPGGKEEATVRVRPLLTAVGIGPPGFFWREEGRLADLKALGFRVSKKDYVRYPIPAFLLQHPSAGAILVDTGMHPSCAVDPKQNLGRLGAVFFRGLEMGPRQGAPDQLRELGIEPTDVKVVVMTHLHIDHASAMSEFPEATFVFSRREWEAATGGGAFDGYVRRQFDHAFDYRTIDFDAAEGDSFASFGRAVDLFGDGSVRLAYTPGHTHGHLSVVARVDGGEVLMCGDAAFTQAMIDGSRMNYKITDRHLAKRSLREIQIYKKETPDAVVIPGHDMDAWEALKDEY